MGNLRGSSDALEGGDHSSELEHTNDMGMTQYLKKSAGSADRFPVGKVAGESSYSYNGSSIMHRLLPVDGGGFILACNPRKDGAYNYMGFRVAVTCTACKSRRVTGGGTSDDDSPQEAKDI